MIKITIEQLEIARTAWIEAQKTAAHEHDAWGLLIKSKKALIASLNINGHTISYAQQEFIKFMDEHSKRYSEALKEQEKKSNEFTKLLLRHQKQNP